MSKCARSKQMSEGSIDNGNLHRNDSSESSILCAELLQVPAHTSEKSRPTSQRCVICRLDNLPRSLSTEFRWEPLSDCTSFCSGSWQSLDPKAESCPAQRGSCCQAASTHRRSASVQRMPRMAPSLPTTRTQNAKMNWKSINAFPSSTQGDPETKLAACFTTGGKYLIHHLALSSCLEESLLRISCTRCTLRQSKLDRCAC